MKSATTVMSSALTADERKIVELYQVTLPTSDVYYFANHDMPIQSHAGLGGQLWTALPLTREPTRFRADLGVDDMAVSIANVSISFGGSATQLSQLVMRGILDGAAVTIYLADLTDPASGQRYYHSDWKVQGAQATRSGISLQLESKLAELNAITPKRTWQEQCTWPLFSTWCTLTRADWTVYGQVIGSGVALGGGTSTSHIEFTVSSKGAQVPATVPGSWFELGQVRFTSGGVNGLSRSIRVQSLSIPTGSAGAFDLLTDLPTLPVSGVQINMVPGCNKTIDHCLNKFNNIDNYGGFPYIPRPETPYVI